MQIGEARELAASLQRSQPAVTYFAHRYAAWLLGRVVGEGVPARSLKESGHRRFLENPTVRAVAARAGTGVLTRAALERAEASRAEVYRIGVATWGPAREKHWERFWYQTTRPGANLALLLYLPRRHDAAYRRLLDPAGWYPAVNRHHPHARPPRIALAWARIDVDLPTGEALIEEVQSDWIKHLGWLWSSALRLGSGRARDRAVRTYFGHPGGRFEDLERYWTRVLAQHRAWWAEATLFAALWLLFERLRVRRIYYHTQEGGRVRKEIDDEPPRSLYTKLPERFGFELTREPPRFLQHAKKARSSCVRGAADLPWYRLEL